MGNRLKGMDLEWNKGEQTRIRRRRMEEQTGTGIRRENPALTCCMM